MTDRTAALSLVKQRLNRLEGDTSLDSYLEARIEAGEDYVFKRGIWTTASTRDLMLVVDVAVWMYQSRDQAGDMPLWLKKMIRDRWLEEVRPRDP